MNDNVHGVIFDWDGTLADSQTLYVAAWRSTLRAFAYEMTRADEAILIGRAFPDAFASLSSRIDLGTRPIFETTWRKKFDALTVAGVELFPDAVGCVRHVIHSHVRLAVATQTPRAQFDKALALTGLDTLITVSVCRDEVAAPKPAPDIYLEACQRIDRSPQDCLAIEDSPVGAASARAAGLRVLGIAREDHSAGLLAESAHHVVTRLTPDCIGRMLAATSTCRK